MEQLERVHATGTALHADSVPRRVVPDAVPHPVTAAVGVSRHGDCLLLTWRIREEAAAPGPAAGEQPADTDDTCLVGIQAR